MGVRCMCDDARAAVRAGGGARASVASETAEKDVGRPAFVPCSSGRQGRMIRHSMSESAREGLELLHRGAPALKHGRAGKPHSTVFTLSPDDASLSWTPLKRGSITKLGGSMKRLSGSPAEPKKRELLVSDVVELLVGRESTIFKRRANETGNEHLSLSLVLTGALPMPPSAADGVEAVE